MKKYQSHKVVHGGLIIGVELPIPGDDKVVIHVQGENKPFRFKESFIARGTPVKNESYLVLYNKGTDEEYCAWCPKHIFEAGNHLFDEESARFLDEESKVELKIDDRRVLQQIRDDAHNSITKGMSVFWKEAWFDLSRAANQLDAMMVHKDEPPVDAVINSFEFAYEDLENALASGKCVEACSLDQDGSVFEWEAVDDISRLFHPYRYRIAACDVTDEPGRIMTEKESLHAVEKFRHAVVDIDEPNLIWVPVSEVNPLIYAKAGDVPIQFDDDGMVIYGTDDIKKALHFNSKNKCTAYCAAFSNSFEAYVLTTKVSKNPNYQAYAFPSSCLPNLVAKWIPTWTAGLMASSADSVYEGGPTNNVHNVLQFDTEEQCDQFCRNRPDLISKAYRINIGDDSESHSEAS